MVLQTLLLSIEGLDLLELEGLARREYSEGYLDFGKYGKLCAHDGSLIMFHADRFEHAFFTSPNRGRSPYEKTKLDFERVRRIRWIREVVVGNIPDSECWELPGGGKRRVPPDRLYVVWSEGYVVWLLPRKESGFNFSSAYSSGRQQIRDYLRRGGRRIWSWKEGWNVENKEDAP